MTRPKHRRRRSRSVPVFALVAPTSVVVLIALLVIDPWSSPHGRTASSTTSTNAPTTTTLITTTTSPRWLQLNDAVATTLANRSGTVEAAVEDLATGAVWTYGAGVPQDEASIVKVNILTVLLANSTAAKATLSTEERSLAEAMIEQSDNDAATTLWSRAGSAEGIGAFDERLGMNDTTPSPCVECVGFPWPGWGLTTTTPTDQLSLLKSTFFENDLLSPVDRAFELHLMESVVPSERWGVSGGVAAGATVALKNGWLPLNSAGTDWQINSVGWVHGDGRDYLVALLSTNDPSESYGIDTLNALSAQIWRYVGRE